MLCSACMVALLVYGLKCWLVLRRDEECLDSFHHGCIPAYLVSLVGISSLYILIAVNCAVDGAPLGSCWIFRMNGVYSS